MPLNGPGLVNGIPGQERCYGRSSVYVGDERVWEISGEGRAIVSVG